MRAKCWTSITAVNRIVTTTFGGIVDIRGSTNIKNSNTITPPRYNMCLKSEISSMDLIFCGCCLITPSLYPGDLTRPGDAAVLNLLLSQGKGIVHVMQEAGLIPAVKATQQLREAGFTLSPAPPRSRSAPQTAGIYNPNQKQYTEEEKKRIYNGAINALSFGASVAVVICLKSAGTACVVAPIIGLTAAFMRLIAS